MSLSPVDIEFTFIRSLACGGFILSGSQLSAEDRRERIRVAIMKLQVNNKPLPIDPSITYAEAFKLAYNRPCELRRNERDEKGRSMLLGHNEVSIVDDDGTDLPEDAELGLL